MKIRYFPFGYQMVQGETVLHPQEAEVVRQIFSRYTTGLGYQEISKWLNRESVAYHPNVSWNKHMVKRILENRRYTGRSGWPVIVDAALFDAAEKKRALNPSYPKRRIAQPASAPSDITPLYEPTAQIRRMEKEIGRQLSKRPTPELKVLILQCAAEKYHSLSRGDER